MLSMRRDSSWAVIEYGGGCHIWKVRHVIMEGSDGMGCHVGRDDRFCQGGKILYGLPQRIEMAWVVMAGRDPMD